ncbi:glutamyl-tRNA amidotransferas-like protein subunit A [Lindgomyces ingoldianus]|uniref:Glutamyl-tRNA amidotransferas-like protein subunit A n=1 Tax=Lindgomyces ingoldianus TaxID=673940 RepID=A0ACB6QVR2_9PLEO|nr:glutamyl-tRNA amidotransferas-like protein subunit A [Lindgomyces ingoldianus]KAF2471099.1 glutamyl-tRNA amidotransferas-like protein subunit A [Lindgomyces ingoldianus]
MLDRDCAPSDFVNYPSPIAYEIPYQSPKPPQNPALKGLALHYLSSLLASLPFLQSFFWHNAGFNTLRKTKELEHVEARYDPTVIPIPKPSDEPIASYTSDLSIRVLPKAAKARFYTCADFHEAYKTGTVAPIDVVEALLPLVRRDVEKRTVHSTAFVHSKVELVKKAAEASTQRYKEGKPLGMLDGVPFAVKDEMDVRGYQRFVGTTHDYNEGKEVETSWCVRKLEEEGCVMLGKLTMHELGLDTTNNNPKWGTPLNPYNSSYYTGGSSGGAGYVIAQGLVPFAIGSDGGGSIRIPSNYCGIYGLKPSHSRVSTAPLLQFANTTVVQGPLAANMTDLEISYRILAQPDPSHPLSRQFDPPKLLSTPRKKILGICKPWFDRADPEVKAVCQAAIDYFVSKLSYQVIDISLPLIHEGQLAHAMTILSECVTAQPSVTNLTAANKILLKVAAQTPARDFLLAQRLRNLLMQHLAHLFTTYPGLIIVTPTTPNAGWAIKPGDLSYGLMDGNMQVRNMEYVWLANFTGIPCISFPIGYVDAKQGDGRVPIGLSGNGEWGCEDALIEFGYDGEAWLNEGFEGGRARPRDWVDVLGRELRSGGRGEEVFG